MTDCAHKDGCPHRWAEDEDQYLLDNPEMPYPILAEHLSRSIGSVRMRWRGLGGASKKSCRITGGQRRTWTADEDQFLRDNAYGELTQKEMAEVLGRSWQAVAQRMIKVGAVSGRNGGGWTPEQDKVLESLAGTMGWQEIADYLGKTWGSVQSHAWKKGWAGRRTLTPEQQALREEVRGKYTYDYGPEWPHRRSEALERDGWTCQEPGCEYYSPSGRGLQVHHMVRRKLIKSDDLRWLVTLCINHHMGQDAHWWADYTPDMLSRLPEYQQARLEVLV